MRNGPPAIEADGLSAARQVLAELLASIDAEPELIAGQGHARTACGLPDRSSGHGVPEALARGPVHRIEPPGETETSLLLSSDC